MILPAAYRRSDINDGRYLEFLQGGPGCPTSRFFCETWVFPEPCSMQSHLGPAGKNAVLRDDAEAGKNSRGLVLLLVLHNRRERFRIERGSAHQHAIDLFLPHRRCNV